MSSWSVNENSRLEKMPSSATIQFVIINLYFFLAPNHTHINCMKANDRRAYVEIIEHNTSSAYLVGNLDQTLPYFQA